MNLETSRLESAEKIIKLVRELLLLAVGCYLAWYLIPLLPNLVSQLKGAKVSNFEAFGFKLGLEQAENKLEAALSKGASINGRKDEKPSEENILVAEALAAVKSVTQKQAQNSTSTKPQSTTSNSFWVFLGIRQGDKWDPTNFSLEQFPKKGDTIHSTSTLYKRDSAPDYIKDDWRLGKVIGVINPSDTLEIVRTQPIEGTDNSKFWWAEVIPH